MKNDLQFQRNNKTARLRGALAENRYFCFASLSETIQHNDKLFAI